MDRDKKMKENLDYLLTRYPALEPCSKDIWNVFVQMVKTYENGGKILVAGNGGSAADADHIVGELMKGYMLKRSLQEKINLPELSAKESEMINDQLQYGLKAINLSAHTALNTAFSNDVNPDLIFAQQVFNYGDPGDMYLGISTSGNSKNVYYGGIVAKSRDILSVGLTGKDGGLMQKDFDISIKVPSNITPDIQEYHLPIYHELCRLTEEYFFKEME